MTRNTARKSGSSSSMMSRRQFLSMAGMATAGTVLVACQAAPPAQPAAESGGGEAAAMATIDLIAWFTDRRTINDMTETEAIPDFESINPEITVDMQFVPESEIQQKLLTSNAAGNAPDLSSIDETFLDTLTKENVLLPFPDGHVDVTNELGALTAGLYAIPQGEPDAKFYGLPNGVFSSQIYYNAGLLDELGYSPEDIPTNWEEFITWASDITVWDGDNLEMSGMAFYGNEGGMQVDLRYQLSDAIQGNVFTSQSSNAVADDVGVLAWEFVMDLYHVHRLDSIDEGLNSRDRFGAGRAVTLYNWTWFNGLMDTQYTDIDWGLRLPPTLSGDPIYGRRGPDVGFTVTTQNADHEGASWLLHRYLLSPAYLSKYCKLRGVQPSLKEMWDDPNFSEEAGPRWAPIAVKNRPENSVDEGFNPRELGDIFGRSVASIRDEGEDIFTVLKRAEDAGNEFLQASPQWSILSREEYEANPDWLTPAG